MNSLVRGLPTENIETILTVEMPSKPPSQNKNVITPYMTSSIRHQFFEFSQGDRPDFPLSNIKKKTILVLSSLSSIRLGLCTKYSKFLTQPRLSDLYSDQARALRAARAARPPEVQCCLTLRPIFTFNKNHRGGIIATSNVTKSEGAIHLTRCLLEVVKPA